MAYTRAWSTTRPDGAVVAANTLDSEIQFVRKDLEERLAGIFGLTSGEWAADPIVPKTLTLSGALVSGAHTINGALTGATTGAFSSNVTVGGTLGVTGVTTLSGLLTIPDGSGFRFTSDAGVFYSGGEVRIGNYSSGVATLRINSTTGAVSIVSTLAVTGTTTLTGTVTAQGQLFSQNSIIAGFGGAASSNTAFASPYIGVGDTANGKNLAMQMNASFGADWWYFPGNVKLMTLSNSGNLGVFGTLAVSGATTLAKVRTSGNSTGVSAPTGVATTLFTMDAIGTYDITAYEVGGSLIYSIKAFRQPGFVQLSGTPDISNGSISVGVSGEFVQVTQTSGSTKTIAYYYTHQAN